MNKTKNYALGISLIIALPLIAFGIGYGFTHFFLNDCSNFVDICNNLSLIALLILPIISGLYGLITYLPVLKDIRNGKQNVWDYHD